MSVERHYVDEVGKVLTRYLQYPESDCPGVDLEKLTLAAKAHLRKRREQVFAETGETFNKEYWDHCAGLLVTGVMMLRGYMAAWEQKDTHITTRERS